LPIRVAAEHVKPALAQRLDERLRSGERRFLSGSPALTLEGCQQHAYTGSRAVRTIVSGEECCVKATR
jgi:hypothetical protein